MKTIELQLDDKTFERAQRVAASRHRTVEDLLTEIIERLEAVESAEDPFLGMFADESELMEQVVESAMQAREERPKWQL